MDKRRIALKIAYDGSPYCGWQVQPHCKSIQSTIEKALYRMTDEIIGITCAGRTDSGVHATGQYAHFDYDGRMTPYQMTKALNRLLDYDIRIVGAWDVPPDFHARYKAYERQYSYLLAKEIIPFQRLYMGYLINQRLELSRMQELATVLLGSHDFSSFAVANPEIPNRICDLKELSITETESHYVFCLRADRFLHNMVRRIVGSLANLCTKSLDKDTLSRILTEADPKQTMVVPAPAAGLYLTNVLYPDIYQLN